VHQKSGRFESERFEDQYEIAMIDLINQKRAGKTSIRDAASRRGIDDGSPQSSHRVGWPTRFANRAKPVLIARSVEHRSTFAIEGQVVAHTLP
jgi:hypothetical protein